MLIAVGHLTALLLLTLVNDGIMAQQRSTDQSASDVLVVGRNKRLFLLSSDVFRSRRNNWISNSNRDVSAFNCKMSRIQKTSSNLYPHSMTNDELLNSQFVGHQHERGIRQ